MDPEEHKAYHRRLIYIIVVLLLILFGSATYYHYVEKWKYLDAIYFSAETMTTVGFGDITPKTDAGKIFTIFFMFTGVGIALYGLSLIAAHFVESREEFWLQKFGKIRIKHHTETFWEKLKKMFFYESGEISKEYEESKKKER